MTITKATTFGKYLFTLITLSLIFQPLRAEIKFEFEQLDIPDTAINGVSISLVDADGSHFVMKGTRSSENKDENIPLVYHWSQKHGYTHLGLLQKRNVLIPMDMSDDGKVVIGHNGGSSFIWTKQNKMKLIPNLKRKFISAAISISGNGQTIVGYTGWRSNIHAFRWTRGQKIEDIGAGANKTEWRMALLVSKDGKVVIGNDKNNVYIWREKTGAKFIESPKDCYFIPEAVSSNGRTIAGRCSIDSPIIWNETHGFKHIPMPEGASRAMFSDMSGDGKNYLGSVSYMNANYKTTRKPALWRKDKIYFIDDEIKKLNPGMDFKHIWVSDISTDGHVLVGGYQLDNSYSYPWKLTIKY